MSLPFPGMNPYLERAEVWHDFHTRFIPAAATAIGKLIAPRYFTKIEEHLYVHEPSAEERFSLGRPEISVHPRTDIGPSAGNVALIDAPASVGMPTDVDFDRVPQLSIVDRFNRETVTILELLNHSVKLLDPSNKYAGADRSQYVSKVKRVLEVRVHSGIVLWALCS